MIVIKINGYVNGFYDKLINVDVIDLLNQVSVIFAEKNPIETLTRYSLKISF